MAVGDAHVFSGFLTPVLTQLSVTKPPTTFLTYISRNERRKYAGKKVLFNRVSNSQPPGHESDTLINEPPGYIVRNKKMFVAGTFSHSYKVFYKTKDNYHLVNRVFRLSSITASNSTLHQTTQFSLSPNGFSICRSSRWTK